MSRRRSPRSRGQALTEIAITLPILVLVLCGIADFALAFRALIALTNAAREGARFGAVGNAAGAYPANCGGAVTTVVGRVCATMSGLDTSRFVALTVTYPGGQLPGQSVVVTGLYRQPLVTPLASLLGIVGWNQFNLTATADARLE